jgi:hypothetical protein
VFVAVKVELKTLRFIDMVSEGGYPEKNFNALIVSQS